MKRIAYFWTRFLPSYPKVLVYMLQTSEYRVAAYGKWLLRLTDVRRVMRRGTLVKTAKARLLLALLRLEALVIILLVAGATLELIETGWNGWWLVIAGLVVTAPFVLAYSILLPLVLGGLLIQKPRERAMIRRSEKILANHPGKRVVVLGSYGKTTAKEMLRTVLAQGMKVASTPGNMNTAIGISRFVAKLSGDEEVLIFELGEEKSGDIQRLARIVHPDTAIITGINEAHLESFRSLERTVATIYEITDFVPAERMYQNGENQLIIDHGQEGILYSRTGVGEWTVSDAATSIDGTSFVLKHESASLAVRTGLLGLHTVGVSAAVAAIAHSLGMQKADIEAGFRNVVPFEHRMEPKPLHGAWIIDDTYNGNSDGVKAGLELLASLEARRKVYVTPGLVEQGSETARVHREIGERAAIADVVVLMKNSVTHYIQEGLAAANFAGELLVIDHPVAFYTNLDQFVAAGDVVLMQNDWPDNYA